MKYLNPSAEKRKLKARFLHSCAFIQLVIHEDSFDVDLPLLLAVDSTAHKFV